MKYIRNNPNTGLPADQEKKANNQNLKASSQRLGIAGDPLFEAINKYNQAPCEKVIQGKGDSWIVMGRDRVGNLLQGRGMEGEAKSSAIDIVVGRFSGATSTTDSFGQAKLLDPSFQRDAARVYISQRTDVDKSFGIAKGKVGNFQNRSAIAIKADGIRLLSREGIKLVTNNDTYNSKGIEPTSCGIDLIALNDSSDMQPIPKGENLRNSLERLTKHVMDLNKCVTGFLLYQMKMNLAIKRHVHVSPFQADPDAPPLVTAPSQILDIISGPYIMKDLQGNIDRSLQVNRKDLQKFKLKYLTKGEKSYINSEHNHTN